MFSHSFKKKKDNYTQFWYLDEINTTEIAFHLLSKTVKITSDLHCPWIPTVKPNEQTAPAPNSRFQAEISPLAEILKELLH